MKITSSQGSCSDFHPKDQSLRCDIGNLSATGGTATVLLEVKPMTVGDFVNNITALPQNADDDVDLTNNSLTVSTDVYK